MRYLCLITISFLAFPILSRAQEQETRDPERQGHVFFAAFKRYPGGGDASELGGGGEGRIYKGLFGTGDLGYVFAEGFSSGVGLLSVGGAYHFPLRKGPTPFVSSGYGLAFRNGTANLYYFGGGATQWFAEWMGARFEVRDYMDCWCNSHTVQLRLGLAFR